MQYVIAGRSTRSMVVPGLTIFACRNNGVCARRTMASWQALGVVCAVSNDTGDDFVRTNLVEQAWQYRRIAGGIVHHLNGTDFQGRGVYPKCTFLHCRR